MVFSASYASSYAKHGDSLYTIRKHLIYVVAGIAIMIFLAKFPPPTFYDLFYYTYYLLKIVEYSHFLKNHIGNPKKPITPKIADIKQNTTTILISESRLYADFINRYCCGLFGIFGLEFLSC